MEPIQKHTCANSKSRNRTKKTREKNKLKKGQIRVYV